MHLGTSLGDRVKHARRAEHADLDSGTGGAYPWIMKEYRKLLAGSLMTLGNLSVVSLIFGQAVAKDILDWTLVALGVTIFTISHLLAYGLMKGADYQ